MHKYENLFVCLSGALALSMSASICDTHFSNSCNISCNDIIYFNINNYVSCCIFRKYPAIRCTLLCISQFAKFKNILVLPSNHSFFIFIIFFIFITFISWSTLSQKPWFFSIICGENIRQYHQQWYISQQRYIHNITKLIHCFNQNCF